MSTKTGTRFGYCITEDHKQCPTHIHVERTDKQGRYAKDFWCGCACHDKEEA